MTDEALLPYQKITAKSKHQHLQKERGQMTRRPQTTQDFLRMKRKKLRNWCIF